MHGIDRPIPAFFDKPFLSRTGQRLFPDRVSSRFLRPGLESQGAQVRRTIAQALITLGLSHPFAQRFALTANLCRD
jgi:hypothetical protein